MQHFSVQVTTGALICALHTSPCKHETKVVVCMTSFSSPVQVQCCALDVLPLAPTAKLIKLFTDGELAKHVSSCLQSSLPDVRVAAVTCAAHLLSSQELLVGLASSGSLLTAITQWAGALGRALTDTAPAVNGAAHAAVQRLLWAVAKHAGSDAGLLQDKLAGALCQQVVKSLGTILEQAQMLPASEQVGHQNLSKGTWCFVFAWISTCWTATLSL